MIDGVHVGRWKDDSGAVLVMGWCPGELMDFIPACTAGSGGLLAGCRPLHGSVAFAEVVENVGA